LTLTNEYVAWLDRLHPPGANVMRSVRFSIAGLMFVVLVTAIALAALRSPSQIWAGVLLLATLAALCIALVGAFCRSGPARGGWIGFAVFGWVYMGAAFEPYEFWPKLPTQNLLEWLSPRLGGPAGPFAGFGGMGGGMGGMGGGMRSIGSFGGGFGGAAAVIVPEPFFQIGHCLLALLAACLGALLGNRVFGAGVDKSEQIIAPPPAAEAEARPRKPWIVPMLLMLSSAALLALIAITGAMLPPGLWAGSTFVLTWILIGLVALGALLGRARPREAWLGATLFGAGFMLLPFGRFAGDPWPRPPTVEFLDEIRPWLPAVAKGLRVDPTSITAANARIHEALKRHVPMHFNEETPLEDFLKYINQATESADGKGIPIYVDPIGLQEAEKTMTSTIRNMGYDGVPLRTSLRHCLKQLGLAYSVQDGLLFITSQESYDSSFHFVAADAFQVVGHCVLALLAAGLGGLAAPFVCGRAQKGPG
jgi:hypothetical protein